MGPTPSERRFDTKFDIAAADCPGARAAAPASGLRVSAAANGNGREMGNTPTVHAGGAVRRPHFGDRFDERDLCAGKCRRTTVHGGVIFENDDHVFVRAPLSALGRDLPPLLHRMRLQLHQQEMLAEIFATDGGPGERRIRLEVELPFERASYAALQKLHRIFDDAGRSGASQFDDRLGVHVYSSIAPEALSRIRAGLRSAGYAFTSSPSNFITDAAAPCRRH